MFNFVYTNIAHNIIYLIVIGIISGSDEEHDHPGFGNRTHQVAIINGYAILLFLSGRYTYLPRTGIFLIYPVLKVILVNNYIIRTEYRNGQKYIHYWPKHLLNRFLYRVILWLRTYSKYLDSTNIIIIFIHDAPISQ